jgi:hypothetical protein
MVAKLRKEIVASEAMENPRLVVLIDRNDLAPAAAQRVVCRLVRVSPETFLSAPAAAREARTIAPSTHHRSQSKHARCGLEA